LYVSTSASHFFPLKHRFSKELTDLAFSVLFHSVPVLSREQISSYQAMHRAQQTQQQLSQNEEEEHTFATPSGAPSGQSLSIDNGLFFCCVNAFSGV